MSCCMKQTSCVRHRPGQRWWNVLPSVESHITHLILCWLSAATYSRCQLALIPTSGARNAWRLHCEVAQHAPLLPAMK